MRISQVCFICSFHYFVFSIPDNNYIEMIVDVIKSTDRAPSVVAHVCWKPSKQVKLMSRLMNMKSRKTVHFVSKQWVYKEPMNRERIMVVTDLNCPEVEEFLILASVMKKMSFPYRWLVIGKSFVENGTMNHELNLPLLPDSDVIVAQMNNNNAFVLTMAYKVNLNSTWQSEYFGTWTLHDGLKKSELADSSISTRRKNFGGEPIKTVMVILDNKTKSDPYDLTDVLADTVTKSSFRSIDPIYGYLNASKYLIFSETWGYYKNGTYGGMVAELTVGDAELSGTILIATKDRMDIVEFLSCPTAMSVKFVFREPPLSYQNNLFLLPFKTSVWYCMGAFVLVLTVILYINVLWEHRKLDNCESNATDPTFLKQDVSEITLLVLSAITQQGSFTELKGTLGRIVMFILFFAFLLLYAAYSASIVALLQSSSNQVRTLTDLLNSRLELGVEDTPYNRYFFAIASEPVRKAIYQTKIAPEGKKPRFMSIEEGVRKLQNEPFAFNMFKGIGYRLVERYFHEHEKCGLQEIAFLEDTKTYIVCRKSSPYTEIFKIGLSRIKEHGLSDRESRLIYARKPACSSRGGSFGSVNMVDFHPVLVMYTYGILLAFLLLCIEVLVHRKMGVREQVEIVV